MGDFSVYVTVRNDIKESLVNGWSRATEGQWKDFPSTIAPNTPYSFELNDTAWFTGTEGTFYYDIRDAGGRIRAKMDTYQMNPYIGDNTISYTPPIPMALYAFSFRARAGDGGWMDNYVAANGYPVYVEYTIKYQTRLFRFQVNEIIATSNHPVRNSRKQLIAGRHTLWSRANSSIYADGNRGSFQPNVFGYTFGSQVANIGILDVTVQPLDLELIGAEVILFGLVNGRRVLQSDYFFFTSLNAVTVQAHVVTPTTSAGPFSLNADVDWGMELRLSNHALQRVGPGISRVELYWIATTIHRAFKPYIPVAFLRSALRVGVMAMATSSEFYRDMTNQAFASYHKTYDTVSGGAKRRIARVVVGTDSLFLFAPGSSAFGVGAQGGDFYIDLYLLADDSGQDGTLFPYVNCMDQTAMVELLCSLLGGFSSTSWLYQQPFGYINTTHLVGLKLSGSLINVNNPFFGTDTTRALVDINDRSRTYFGVHVYVGHSNPFNLPNDGIYDACCGPHVGTETTSQYLANVIDINTELYRINGTSYGTTGNVAVGVGVTNLNAEGTVRQLRRTVAPLAESLSRLVDTAVTNTMGTLTHENWARLPTWLKAILGDAWDIQYGQVTASEAEAQAFWLISDASAHDSRIRVHINVVSVLSQDGMLDMEESAVVVRERVGHILSSTERHDIWTSRTLPGLEEASLQYTDNVAAGRIVVVAGNVVMDIAGMTSSEALLPHAMKLLNHTVRRGRSTLVVPVLRRKAIRLGVNTGGTVTLRGPEAEAGVITVAGIDTRFSVVLSVSCEIAAAGAACDEAGVLFDHHAVDELTVGKWHSVELFFIAREVGRHHVHIYVADVETMVGATLALEIEVVSV